MSDSAQQPETESGQIDPELQKYHSPENFFKTHAAQFEAMGLPTTLWKKVYTKIYTTEDDVTDVFKLQYVEGEGFRLVCKKDGGLKKEEDVWVIEHAWTTTEELAKKHLLTHEELLPRMWKMMDLDRRLQEAEAVLNVAREAKERGQTLEEYRETLKSRPAIPKKGTSTGAKATVDQVELVMEHTGANQDVAGGALVKADGDLLNAIGYVNDAQNNADALKELADLCISESGATTKLSTPLPPDSAASAAAASDPASAAATAASSAPATSTPAPAASEDAKAAPAGTTAASAASSAPAGIEVTTLDNLTLLSSGEYEVTWEGVTKKAKDLTKEEKADIVVHMMKECGYANVYHIMKPREDGSTGPVRPDEVQTIIYVLDEIGSAIRFSDNPNVNLPHLVIITQGGLAVSLLWPSRDIAEGEVITRRPPAYQF